MNFTRNYPGARPQAGKHAQSSAYKMVSVNNNRPVDKKHLIELARKHPQLALMMEAFISRRYRNRESAEEHQLQASLQYYRNQMDRMVFVEGKTEQQARAVLPRKYKNLLESYQPTRRQARTVEEMLEFEEPKVENKERFVDTLIDSVDDGDIDIWSVETSLTDAQAENWYYNSFVDITESTEEEEQTSVEPIQEQSDLTNCYQHFLKEVKDDEWKPLDYKKFADVKPVMKRDKAVEPPKLSKKEQYKLQRRIQQLQNEERSRQDAKLAQIKATLPSVSRVEEPEYDDDLPAPEALGFDQYDDDPPEPSEQPVLATIEQLITAAMLSYPQVLRWLSEDELRERLQFYYDRVRDVSMVIAALKDRYFHPVEAMMDDKKLDLIATRFGQNYSSVLDILQEFENKEAMIDEILYGFKFTFEEFMATVDTTTRHILDAIPGFNWHDLFNQWDGDNSLELTHAAIVRRQEQLKVVESEPCVYRPVERVKGYSVEVYTDKMPYGEIEIFFKCDKLESVANQIRTVVCLDRWIWATTPKGSGYMGAVDGELALMMPDGNFLIKGRIRDFKSTTAITCQYLFANCAILEHRSAPNAALCAQVDTNYVGELQVFAQKQAKSLPIYVESPGFVAKVTFDGKSCTSNNHSTKKAAKQEAAHMMLKLLRNVTVDTSLPFMVDGAPMSLQEFRDFVRHTPCRIDIYSNNLHIATFNTSAFSETDSFWSMNFSKVTCKVNKLEIAVPTTIVTNVIEVPVFRPVEVPDVIESHVVSTDTNLIFSQTFNYVSRLQELTQARKWALPVYTANSVLVNGTTYSFDAVGTTKERKQIVAFHAYAAIMHARAVLPSAAPVLHVNQISGKRKQDVLHMYCINTDGWSTPRYEYFDDRATIAISTPGGVLTEEVNSVLSSVKRRELLAQRFMIRYHLDVPDICKCEQGLIIVNDVEWPLFDDVDMCTYASRYGVGEIHDGMNMPVAWKVCDRIPVFDHVVYLDTEGSADDHRKLYQVYSPVFNVTYIGRELEYRNTYKTWGCEKDQNQRVFGQDIQLKLDGLLVALWKAVPWCFDKRFTNTAWDVPLSKTATMQYMIRAYDYAALDAKAVAYADGLTIRTDLSYVVFQHGAGEMTPEKVSIYRNGGVVYCDYNETIATYYNTVGGEAIRADQFPLRAIDIPCHWLRGEFEFC